MRQRNRGRTLVAAATALSVVLTTAILVRPAAAQATEGIAPDNPCLSAPEDVNHANIRLDEPAEGTRIAVDDQGKITVRGVLHKQAYMADVTVDSVVTTQFTFGPPPAGVSDWAASWTTAVRPPHLGATQLCARAARDPKWQARVLRHVTVVDLIPPSNVPGLSVGDVTSSSAKVTWGAATDNYGLAGYDVAVDGGTAVRTTVGTTSYAVTGLSPSTHHTVSVVAVDLAGNRSATPATVAFTTTAPPPPPDASTGLVLDPQEGYATASWHPDPTGEVTYQAFLDGVPWEDFPVSQYCRDASGNPASPCTADDLVSYQFGELEAGTPYQVQIRALGADGTQSRELSATFTTLAGAPAVARAAVELVASESSRCAMMGGSFYTSPSVRGQVPVPADSTQLFDGCYKATNTSCFDSALPTTGNKVLTCADDITHVLYAVAPPGRGPVISAMEGTTTAALAPAYVPNPVMEPVNWCVESPVECVEIIADAAEAGALVAEEAGVAVAVASFIVVAAEGIGLGLVLGVLISLLWSSTVGIADLLEYPINYDTDFDTYTNWGQGNGAWVGTLKTYAEVIKTTRQVAADQGLPFSWDVTNDRQLREAIDTACGAVAGRPPNEGNVCPDNLTVYVPGGTNYKGSPLQETGMHIADALGNGIADPKERAAWYYPAYSQSGKLATAAGFKRNWYDVDPRFNQNDCRPADSTSEPPRPAGKPICDEFPFFSTNQAVNLSGITASLRAVPEPEKDAQFRDLGSFYRSCRVHDGDHFVVLPVRSWVQAGGPSFAFQVNQGGADLCLKPQQPSTP
jgi:hypothetical protein